MVAADCLEARKLEKVLREIERPKIDGEDVMGAITNVKVIWGRPEVPKLFASSLFSKKALKTMPFVLKKAVSLARFEQDPMSEVLNLWSPIINENQALNLNLHPLQKFISKARILDTLELVNIQVVNNVGVDINMLTDHEHLCNQLQFVSGLGPRKALTLIRSLKKRGSPLITRRDLEDTKMMGSKVFKSAASFLKVRAARVDQGQLPNFLDQTRIQISDYELMERIACIISYRDEDFSKMSKENRSEAVRQLFEKSDKLRDDAVLREIKEELHNSEGTDFEKEQ